MNVIIYRLPQLDSIRLIWTNFVFLLKKKKIIDANFYIFEFFTLILYLNDEIIFTSFVHQDLKFPHEM